MMTITAATNERRNQVIALLAAEKLPVDDLPANLDSFWVADMDGELAGAIGMETYGDCVLLRSMVVSPNHRNKGIAERLVHTLETAASEKGKECVYLLTETADRYFAQKGYTVIGRDEVPEALRVSSEFSHVCPVSAIVMKKNLV